MLVTLFGMVTVVNVIHVPNALDPMLVTGRPLIVPGMTMFASYPSILY